MRGAGEPLLGLIVLGAVVGCGAPPATDPAGTVPPASPTIQVASSAPSSDLGLVIEAPGSGSSIFEPNPGAITVFIDPGHGGCLDWGVPNPFDNTVEKAEKTMTLAVSLALARLLEAEGVGVVLARTSDEALAGDLEPDFGCLGEPFRDVNGDGQVGFDEEGNILARDELTARIDLANLSRADVFLSIHVNSITENDQVFEIAATQTFYTDETPWGELSAALADTVQAEVIAALEPIADYPRQDRGVQAINYYVIAPPLTDPDADEPNPRKRPRGILMPGVLAEVGSMSLGLEAELLVTNGGQEAIALGLRDAVRSYLDDRALAVRYDALVEGGGSGQPPPRRPGDGPPFTAAEVPAADLEAPVVVRLTNTGTAPWPAGAGLAVGWASTDEPYLATPPDRLVPLDVEVPALRPGEFVELPAQISVPAGAARQVLWVTLAAGGTTFADLGSPALQLAVVGP